MLSKKSQDLLCIAKKRIPGNNLLILEISRIIGNSQKLQIDNLVGLYVDTVEKYEYLIDSIRSDFMESTILFIRDQNNKLNEDLNDFLQFHDVVGKKMLIVNIRIKLKGMQQNREQESNILHFIDDFFERKKHEPRSFLNDDPRNHSSFPSKDLPDPAAATSALFNSVQGIFDDYTKLLEEMNYLLDPIKDIIAQYSKSTENMVSQEILKYNHKIKDQVLDLDIEFKSIFRKTILKDSTEELSVIKQKILEHNRAIANKVMRNLKENT